MTAVLVRLIYGLRLMLPGRETLLLEEPEALRSNYLPAANLDRYLGQGELGRAVHDLSPVLRIEDGAVAGADELPVLVGYLALLVRADCRVGYEVPALQVDEHRSLPRVLELERGSGSNLRGPGDGLSARSLLPLRATGLLAGGLFGASPATGIPAVPATAARFSSVVGPATAISATTGSVATARGEDRSASGAHA